MAGNSDVSPDADTVIVARYNSDGTPIKVFMMTGKLYIILSVP